MDVLLAILCVLALLLLFVGQREGFTGDCGTDGSPAPASWGVLTPPMRVYTRTECETNHNGTWYDAGKGDGLGFCIRRQSGEITYYDFSKDCAFLNTTPATPAAPAAPAAPAVPPAPAVTSMTAPLPAAMPTPTGGNTITSLPIPGMPSLAPQAAGVMTSTPVGAPLGSGTPHGILLTIV